MDKHNLENIKYSILDLATVSAGDNLKLTFDKSMKAAQYAETLGFSRYWFSEHHNMESVASAATSILIGYIAQGTKNMRIGSGGIMLPNHSPLIIAEQFGTLGSMFPGRIDLGLGRAPGTDSLTAMTIRNSPPHIPYDFKSNIKQLQQYFNSENATAKVRALPGEGVDVPIWMLGSSTDSAILAAELGLPYAFAAHFAPAQLMPALNMYRNYFKPSKALEKPYTLACVNVIAADTTEEAQFLSTSLFRLFQGIFSNSRSPLQPPVPFAELEKSLTPDQRAGINQMLSCTFIGSKEEAGAELKEFLHVTRVDELMVTSYLFDFEKRLYNYKLVQEIMSGS